jgi:2-polyprenyl-3-methyl-5-hydroxy-6-metoxy-1,4-benzoquinol methylase
MNQFSTQIKPLLHKLGIYPLVRSLYRKVHPAHRRDNINNKNFYASIISPGDLCFDIGANVGQTIEALAAANAIIVAIERTKP